VLQLDSNDVLALQGQNAKAGFGENMGLDDDHQDPNLMK
jgi:hypothetical protein